MCGSPPAARLQLPCGPGLSVLSWTLANQLSWFNTPSLHTDANEAWPVGPRLIYTVSTAHTRWMRGRGWKGMKQFYDFCLFVCLFAREQRWSCEGWRRDESEMRPSSYSCEPRLLVSLCLWHKKWACKLVIPPQTQRCAEWGREFTHFCSSSPRAALGLIKQGCV